MTIQMKWICETCGLVFSGQIGADAHLDSNNDHIIDEVYINSLGNGVPKSSVIQSPDGTIWKVTIDDNGVITTEEVE